MNFFPIFWQINNYDIFIYFIWSIPFKWCILIFFM